MVLKAICTEAHGRRSRTPGVFGGDDAGAYRRTKGYVRGQAQVAALPFLSKNAVYPLPHPIIDKGKTMNLPDAPVAREGFFVTHFFTVRNQEKSKEF